MYFATVSSYQAKVRKVNEAILEEIRKAINKLFEITAFPAAYKDFPADIDYKTFVEKLGPALEHEAPFGLLWAINDFQPDEESLAKSSSQDPELISTVILTGYLFTSPEYNPPEEVADLLLHLVSLYQWCKANAEIQSYFFATHHFLAFGKLLAAVSKLDTISIMKGEREIKRVKKGTEAKKEKTDKRKGFVIAIYEHGGAIGVRTKFNTACDTVQQQFDNCRGKKEAWGTIPKDPKKMRTPSLASIDRWLKEAGIRDRDFKQEGRYWIKQT